MQNLEFAFIRRDMAIPDRDTGDLVPFVVPGPIYWTQMGPSNMGRMIRREDILFCNPGWVGGAAAKFIRSVDVDNLGGMQVYNHIAHKYEFLVVRDIPLYGTVLNWSDSTCHV